MRPVRSLLLPAAVLALAACRHDDASEVPAAPLSGTFDVTSRFEVPATVAAPGPLGDTLRLVHGLATEPGAALLDLAELAGVPAVGVVRAIVPDSVLVGWMDEYLETAAVNGVSPHAQIVALDELVRSVLLSWELRSTLVLPEGAGGRHEPVALAFGSPLGPVELPLDATAPITSGTGVVATVSWPDGPAGAAVATVGDHAMGLPFGRYALEALDAVLAAQSGAADVAAFLSAAVGCDALAASVAARCLGFVCLGHEAELRAVCEGGVAEAAAQLEERILALDFQAIRFERGRAVAAGAALAPPQPPGALEDGVWTAWIDVGNGAEAATATFSAVREAP